ncbi:MAG: hypothetical protein O2904_01190 [bacterium]|nr:hypothetical protein [bacterium]
MLHHSTHNQIAFNLSPEWERRLLCVTGDDDTSGLESLGSAENLKGLEDTGTSIESMQATIGSAINAGVLSKENLEAIVHNPSILSAALQSGLMSDEKRYELEQFLRKKEPETFGNLHPELHIPARQIVEFLQNEDNADTAESVKDVLSETLDTPEALLSLTTQLDQRLGKYELLQKILYEHGGLSVGNLINIEKIQQFFDEWHMKGLEGNEVDIADWLCDTYDIREPDAGKLSKVFNEIFNNDLDPELTRNIEVIGTNPDPKNAEFNRANEAALKRIKKIALENGDAKQKLGRLEASYKGLKHRISHATTAFTQFLRMQDNDQFVTPSNETQRNRPQTVDALRSEVQKLKIALDGNLKERAALLESNLKNRLEQDGVLDADGTLNAELVNNPDEVRALYGISNYALLGQVIPRAYGDVQRIQRIADPEVPANEQDVAPEIGDENYLSYARNALTQLDELERREGDRDATGHRGFEEQYFDEAVFEQEQSTQWAQRIVSEGKLQALTTEIVNGNIPESVTTIQDLLRDELQYQDDGTDPELKKDQLTEADIDEFPQALVALRKLAVKVARPSASGQDITELYYQLNRFGQDRIMMILGLLEDRRTREGITKVRAQLADTKEVLNNEQTRDKLTADVAGLRESLSGHKHLKHTVCKTLQIGDGLNMQYGEILTKLKYASAYEGKKKALKSVREAKVRIDQMKQAVKFLDGLDNAFEEYQGDVGSETFGAITGDKNAPAFYNRDTGMIMLNRPAITKSKKSLDEHKRHETGHAILHILTERSGLLDGKLFQILNIIRQDVPQSEKMFGSNTTFEKLLHKQAVKWGLERKEAIILYRANQELGDQNAAAAKTKEQFDELLFDELINKHADWVEGGRKTDSTDPEQIALFQHIDDTLVTDDQKITLDQQLLHNAELGVGKVDEALGSFDNGDDDNGGSSDASADYDTERMRAINDSGAGNGEGGNGNGQDGSGDSMDDDENRADKNEVFSLDINKKIRDQRAEIEKIRVTYESYREFKSVLEPKYVHFLSAHNHVKEAFLNKTSEDENVNTALLYIDDSMAGVLQILKDIKNKKLDLTNAPREGKKGWRRIWDHVEFMSVMDIVNMVKSGAEDIARMWKRRGEAMQARVGEGLTGWIPNSVPYAGRLKNEYHKRAKTSEVEEVNQWKEALKDDDSYELQDLLGTTRNPDMVRAILELLQERGRMNWNDEKFWITLNALSNYNMPIDACRQDDVLRDRWLQKLITDIFGDKEHYFNWKQGNDSAVESGKKKFTPTVDQYANVRGGMDAALANMLELFVEGDKRGNIPEEVNPHLYEEIIHYAIRYGKMSMEGKFFYLIQGIRWGLLPIDRLRTMAGSGGEFINTFPFIDYFYQKNNTLEEVIALGKRLDGEENKFKPDKKTTMFVRMEIAREESVKQRLRKGVSKKGEETDHDDIPYFIPELDYGSVDEWLSNMSGSRQKLSKEALKNAYVGYSMKFKTFAVLAEADQNKSMRFTSADIKDMANTIGSYIHGDNILTKNGFTDKNVRPSLSRGEFGQKAVMANGENSVAEYRNNVNKFIGAAMDIYMNDDAVWNKINAHRGARTPEEIATRKKKRLWIDRSNFALLDLEKNTSNMPLVREIAESTGKFIEILEARMLANPEAFKELLRQFSSGDKAKHFIADGPSGGFTNKEMLKLYNGK